MPAATLSVGTILTERYVLASHAPVSGAPEAWCASMVGNEQPVMVMYFPAGSFEPGALQRIVTEGAELRELRHPRVGALLDLGVEPRGGVYAVTPWYGDDTLARRIERQGAFNLHVAGALMGDVLAALGVLHSRRLVHRAVSPRDITLFIADDGRLRARLLPGGQLAEFGREGVLRQGGTPPVDPVAGEYAAPEQWAGGDATAESDVWAAGVLLHRLAAGALPYNGDGDARRAAVRAGGVRIADTLPPAVTEVLRRALDPRPGGRYTDADAMRVALESAIADSAPMGAALPSRSAAPMPTARPPGPAHADDFDLDDLVADLSRRSSNVPAKGSAAPTALDHPTGASPTQRPPLGDSLRPPAVSQPAPPPSPRKAPEVAGFDLDSLGPPPAGKVAAPPVAGGAGIVPAAATRGDEAIPWRDSQVHTALEAKSIDRTHVKRPARPRGLSVAAAMALVLPVTAGFAYFGWRAMQGPTTPPRVERVRALEPEPLHPARAAADGGAEGDGGAVAWTAQSEAQTAVEFGEQFHLGLPDGLDARGAQSFVAHLITSPSVGPSHPRGFASCVEGRVFMHRGGVTAPLVTATVPARCESQDLALVPDLDGDGAADVIAVDTRRSALLVVGSRRAAVLRRIALPGAWGLAGPLSIPVRGHPEPGVVVFVSTESGAPTLMAVGLQTGRVVWRLPPGLLPAEPRDFGLTVTGDVDGDGAEEVVMGMLRDGQRCVAMLSGATGAPRWDAAFCLPGSATQSVSSGPDLDGDEAADLLVASAADGRLRVVSGRTGREITAVTAQGGEPTTGFGAGAIYAPDLANDGFPDIALARATAPDATLEVYSANDGHRLGVFALHGAVGAVVEANRVRVQFARDFLYPGSASLVVASPVGVFLIGAAPRPEGV
jgi:serine/threonine protein kinase